MNIPPVHGGGWKLGPETAANIFQAIMSIFEATSIYMLEGGRHDNGATLLYGCYDVTTRVPITPI